jgi:hypothetical protein
LESNHTAPGRETCPRQYDEQCYTKIQPQEAIYSIVLGMNALYCTKMLLSTNSCAQFGHHSRVVG